MGEIAVKCEGWYEKTIDTWCLMLSIEFSCKTGCLIRLTQENTQTNDIYKKMLFCDRCETHGNSEDKWEVMNVMILDTI